eukprot:scaffold1820_cov129-Cylindrotheca_fusiformis.AAC.3
MTSNSDGPLGNAPDIGVGASDAALLIVSGAGFIFLAVTIYSIVLTKLKSSAEIEEEERELDYNEELANADVSTLTRAQRRARARHIMKQQRRITPVPGAPGAPEEIAENEQAQVNEKSQLSRKERQKAAKAAEKEERRLYENERRQEQQEAQRIAQKEKKEREKRMMQKADEERLARYEQRMKEEMENYERWRTFLASKDGRMKLTVKEWIAELRASKVVSVDKLAARFGSAENEVERRIQELLDSSRLTGILDGGKFIYLSIQEMVDIASFLQSRDTTTLEQVQNKIQEYIEK